MEKSKKEGAIEVHNYEIEDFEDYAIVRRKKGNTGVSLKVIQFDESIIERLMELGEPNKASCRPSTKIFLKLKNFLGE